MPQSRGHSSPKWRSYSNTNNALHPPAPCERSNVVIDCSGYLAQLPPHTTQEQTLLPVSPCKDAPPYSQWEPAPLPERWFPIRQCPVLLFETRLPSHTYLTRPLIECESTAGLTTQRSCGDSFAAFSRFVSGWRSIKTERR